MSNEIVIRISVPEGMTPVVDYQQGPKVAPQAPTGNAAPSCPIHGPMVHKSGTNKSGKPYSGFFCTVQGCETTPVWDPK